MKPRHGNSWSGKGHPSRIASSGLFLAGLTILSAGTIGFHATADFLHTATVEAIDLPEPIPHELSFHIFKESYSIPMDTAYYLSIGLLIAGVLLLLAAMRRLLRAGPAIKRAPISGLRPGEVERYPKTKMGRKGAKTEAFRLEQENWGLPGFQSLPPPVNNIPASLKALAEGFSKQRSHAFGWQWYRFEHLSTYPGCLSDIELFAKCLLSIAMERLYSLKATLYLLDHRENYQAVLQKRGNIFISGVKEKIGVPEKSVIGRLEEGNYILLNRGLDIFFPLLARGAMLGFVHISRETVINGPLQLKSVWQEICRYGELLWQARLYEQATSDPQSTLLNGMSFQKDLYQSVLMQRGLAIPLELTLIRFHNRDAGSLMRLYGTSLRRVFPPASRLYRIALEVCAMLHWQMAPRELGRCIEELATLIESKNDISVGSAVWRSTMQSPNEWFRQAASELEQSGKLGNRVAERLQPGERVLRQTERRP